MFKPTKRKGFNFFRSYYDVYNELITDAERVAFIDALLDRQFLGVKPEGLTGLASFAYISQVNSIDTQVKGYTDKAKAINKEVEDFDPWQGVNKNDLTPCQQVQEKGKEKGKEEVKETSVKFQKEIIDTYENLIKFFPEALHPKTESSRDGWLDTIEKLIRIEKIPPELIEQIVEAARGDNFWASNFLSLTKLRKKNSDGVQYIKAFYFKFLHNGATKKHNTKSRGVTDDELAHVLDNHFKKQRGEP